MMRPTSRRWVRNISYVVPALFATAARAQVPDTAHSIARIDSTLLAARHVIATEVWPGFDVTRVGLLYMLPRTGKVLARWPHDVDGAEPLGARRVWTTAPVRWGRNDAVQVVPVDAASNRAQVLGLALHEAFHVYQQHFSGAGSVSLVENSMLLPEYPLFDVENEARVAAESELLRAAVEAPSARRARRLAAQFVALRRARHARLPAEIAEFERLGEAHEGVAQYVLLRGLDALAARDPSLQPLVDREHAAERDVLSSTLGRDDLSVRRRLYATGSQMGYLLDRLAGEGWKTRLTSERVQLQDLVAEAVRGTAVDSAELARAVGARLPAAAGAVARRESARADRRREILGASGTLVVLSPAALPAGRFDWCGIDPQNLLPDGEGSLLHTRMLRVCGGGRQFGAYNQPVVENRLTGLLYARADSPTLTANGETVPLPTRGSSVKLDNVKLSTETIEISAPEAVLVGTDAGVIVIPLR